MPRSDRLRRYSSSREVAGHGPVEPGGVAEVPVEDGPADAASAAMSSMATRPSPRRITRSAASSSSARRCFRRVDALPGGVRAGRGDVGLGGIGHG